MQIDLSMWAIFLIGLSFCWLFLVFIIIPGTLILEAIGLLSLVLASSSIFLNINDTPLSSFYIFFLNECLKISICTLLILIGGLILFRLFMPKGWWHRHLVLKSTEKFLENGPHLVTLGDIGVVVTPLVPTGRVKIKEKLYEARLLQGSANIGQSIRVISIESTTTIIAEII